MTHQQTTSKCATEWRLYHNECASLKLLQQRTILKLNKIIYLFFEPFHVERLDNIPNRLHYVNACWQIVKQTTLKTPSQCIFISISLLVRGKFKSCEHRNAIGNELFICPAMFWCMLYISFMLYTIAVRFLPIQGIHTQIHRREHGTWIQARSLWLWHMVINYTATRANVYVPIYVATTAYTPTGVCTPIYCPAQHKQLH